MKLGIALSLVLGVTACGNSSNTSPAPSPTLTPVKPTAGSQRFVVRKDSAKVTFLMDAPIERIYGDAPGSVQGDLFIDFKNIENSKGLVKIDLEQLVIYQDIRESEDAEFSGEKKKSDMQNEHMRTWLEISQDVPEQTRAKNRYIEFKIKKIKAVGDKDLSAMTGDERKMQLELIGDFRLHERTVEKTAKVEAVFEYRGGKPVGVAIHSLEPIAVAIEQDHDVRPRKSFGKIVDWSTQLLTKIDKVPMITLEFEAAVASS